MNHLDEITLNELAEGRAGPELGTGAAHLDTCPVCQVELAAIRELRAALAHLPSADAARPELWTAIASRITEGGAIATSHADVVPLAPRRRIAPLRWAALAAGLMLASAATVRIASTLETHTDTLPATQVAEVSTPEAPKDALAAFEHSRTSYEQAAAELMRTLDARRAELRPETLKIVETNLAVIDGAIEEIRRALAADPTSAELAFLLTSTWETKIELLRRVTAMPERT